jgi:ankyrin repeat protein
MTVTENNRDGTHDEEKHISSAASSRVVIFKEKLDLEKSERDKSESNSIEKNKDEKKKAELEEERKKAADKKKRDDAIKKLWDAIEKNSLEEATAIVEGHPDIFSDRENIVAIQSDKQIPPHFLVILVKIFSSIKNQNAKNSLRGFILKNLSSLSIDATHLLAKDDDNHTALHLAGCAREYEICEAILKAAAEKKVVQELIYLRAKYSGETPLDDIRTHFSREQVKRLLELTYPPLVDTPGSFLNQHVSPDGETELMKKIKECVSREEERETVFLLERVGADVFFCESDWQGNTALHFAILYGKFEIAKKILECINRFGQFYRVFSARNNNQQMPHHLLIELGIGLSLKKMSLIAASMESQAEREKEENEEKEEKEGKEENVGDSISLWVDLCEDIIGGFKEYSVFFAESEKNLSSFKAIVSEYNKDLSQVDPIKRLFFLRQFYQLYSLLLYPTMQKEVYEITRLLAFEVLKRYWEIDLLIGKNIYAHLRAAYKSMQRVPFLFEKAFDLSGYVIKDFDKVARITIKQLEDSKIEGELDSAFSAADFVLASLPQPSSQECQEAYSAIADFFKALKEEKDINDEIKQKIIDYIMKNIVAEIAKGNLKTRKQLQACEQGLKEILIGTPYISKNLQMAINTLFAILAIGLGVGLAVGYVTVSPISAAVLAISFGLFCVKKYSDNNDEIKYHQALWKGRTVRPKLFKVFDGDCKGESGEEVEFDLTNSSNSSK